MIIQVSNVSKVYRLPQSVQGLGNRIINIIRPSYSEKQAVHEVSFSIDQGDIVGLVGPNGAGKSTLVKMLTGILQPTTGSIQLLGVDPFCQRRYCSERIGVLFGQRNNLWWDLAVHESLELYRQIYQLDYTQYCQDRAELVALFGLEDLLDQPVRMLSLGQRVRCSLAAVMLHRPQVLFLDEPTIGLDIMTLGNLLEILQKMNTSRRTTVLIASHDLSVIEKICNRILLFHEGTLLFDGPLQTALASYGRYKKIQLHFDSVNTINQDVFPSAISIKKIGANYVEGIFNDKEFSAIDMLEMIELLTKQQSLREFYIEKPTLNEVIINVYKCKKG